MNIRKGAFRLWLIASVLFIVTVTVVSYDGIRDEFHNANTDWDAEFAKFGGTTIWPVLCTTPKEYDASGKPLPNLLATPTSPPAARGIPGTNYTDRNGTCWYDSKTFRKFYPEYNDLSNRELGKKLMAAAGTPLIEFHPWHKVLETAAIAFGCPLGVLILGWGLVWAFAGFKQPQNP